MCKEFFDKNKEWVHIGASMATIITLIVAIIAVDYQIQQQHKDELQQFINDLKSLKTEITINKEFINYLIEQKEYISDKTIFGEFILRNFEKESSDGRINNELLKEKILRRYFELLADSNSVRAFNSAEFYLTDPVTYKERKSYQYEQLVNGLKNTELPKLNELEDILDEYIMCLNNSKDITKIENCKNIGK